jgi:hypothetical protein
MTEGFSDTFEGDTDIDESSESSSAADTVIDASDDDDEREKKTSLALTPITMPKPILKRESSVRKALEFRKDHQDSNIGLLNYFSQGTKEDVDAYWKKEEERTAVNEEKKNFKKKSVDMERKLHKRDLAWVRQQRKRSRIKEREVKEGVRSPGGKKPKVNSNQNISTRIKLITIPRSLT